MYFDIFDIFDSRYNSLSSTSHGNYAIPQVDLSETDKKYIVELFAPGIDPKEISVELDRGILRITGKYPDRKELKMAWREYPSGGEFERRISLPDGDPNAVSAGEGRGVITIIVGKKNEKRKITLDNLLKA